MSLFAKMCLLGVVWFVIRQDFFRRVNAYNLNGTQTCERFVVTSNWEKFEKWYDNVQKDVNVKKKPMGEKLPAVEALKIK